MDADSHIAIAGAGSIGCFVGGVLAEAGRNVSMLGRGSLAERVQQDGVTISDIDGWTSHLPPARTGMTTNPAMLAEADIILVCVKSGATEEMARAIAAHAKREAIIVSLQNGVTNADKLRAILPDHDVRAGMVAFNVVQLPDGRFHKATSGEIMIEAGAPSLAPLLDSPRLRFVDAGDMSAILWGKLLINLNNALNALANIPIVEQLADPRWRRLFAAAQAEGLAALKAARIKPKAATPIPPRLMPIMLRLPTPLFRRIFGRSMKIDPNARSSMWEDLSKGRLTEIDELQGAVVALAEAHGLDAPVNRRIHAAIRAAEAAGSGPPGLRPADLAP